MYVPAVFPGFVYVGLGGAGVVFVGGLRVGYMAVGSVWVVVGFPVGVMFVLSPVCVAFVVPLAWGLLLVLAVL